MSADKGDYEVGYKKPPIATRFRAGNSGNPKGRVKANRNLKSDLQDELAERIVLKEGGKTLRISKQRALVKSLVVKGIKGDDRAIGRAFDLLLRLVGVDDQPDDAAPLPAADQAILEAFVARQRKGENYD